MARTTRKAPGESRPARSGWVRPLAEQPLHRVRFARSRTDVLLGGVAGGIGERLGVDPVLVRIAFVVLSYAGAVGVVLYMIAWAVSLDPRDPRAPKPRDPSTGQAIAFGLIVLGAVLLLRDQGLWFWEPLGAPLLIAAVGAGVVYAATSRDGRPRRRSVALREPAATRPSLVGLLIGGALVVGGVVWFLTLNRSFEGIYATVLAVTVTVVGLSIVFGPWAYRLLNQLTDERRERIRSEERSELAAHLHDSVLQTLALIQRNAASPRKMASLARRQERELRTWLYGPQTAGPGRLEAAVHEMADAIEEAYEVSIEVVVVGDCPLDEGTRAVVHACREAATNAARHSGSDEISVYVECERDELTAFVRDRGKGFDPASVRGRGRGIADSIRGRVERQGGSVEITSASGEGCEVQIVMPLRGAAE